VLRINGGGIRDSTAAATEEAAGSEGERRTLKEEDAVDRGERGSKAEAAPKPEAAIAHEGGSPTRGKEERRPRGTRWAE
jgi:hypothetical protein